MYASAKYTIIIMDSAVISGAISGNDAPIVCNFINPCTPWVLGNMLANHWSHSGSADVGKDTPLSISSGIEHHKSTIRGVSRQRNSTDKARLIEIHARRYRLINIAISAPCPFIG